MKKITTVVGLLTLVGGLLAAGSPFAPTAASIAAESSPAQTVTAVALSGHDATETASADADAAGAEATEACDPESATEDAASCSTGGWVFRPNLGCCSLSTGLRGRWTRGSSTKCCGGCAQ